MKGLLSFFSKERQPGGTPTSTHDVALNTDVAGLNSETAPLFLREILTLSRRRRCAANHLGQVIDPFDERGLDWKTKAWYLRNHPEVEPLSSVQSDLKAILENPTRVSATFKSRIILTDYFSGSLEDYYHYGDIEPAVFSSEGLAVNFRDTLFDKVNFPQRIQLITSFDPEQRGHRHQIRYFRVLLFAYSLAHILKENSPDAATQQATDLLLQDETELARGWITAKHRAEQLGIDPFRLPPDESLLYDEGKVSESALLFTYYNRYAQRLFGQNDDFLF